MKSFYALIECVDIESVFHLVFLNYIRYVVGSRHKLQCPALIGDSTYESLSMVLIVSN